MARLFNDAATQYLDCTGTPVSTEPMTLSAWFRTDDDAITQSAIGLIGPGGHYAELDIDGANQDRVFCRISNGAVWLEAKTTTAWTTGTWNHACAVLRTATSRSAYLNAGGKATNVVNCSVTLTTDTNIATSDGAGGNLFSGMLAEPAVYNVALTDLEVWLLWMGKPPWEIRPANLVGLWLPFGDVTDRDYSGRGYHMTSYNTPTFAGFDPPKAVRAWRSNPQYMGRRVVGREQPGGVWVRPWGIAPVAAVTAGKLVDSIRLKSLVHGGLA